jgi:hypothetical protein
MDPRIRLLIDEVRRLHVPLVPPGTSQDAMSYCHACKGLEYNCPILKIADELEKEDDQASEESSSD